MASDRARISYDPSRAYRAVVAQQGRVTLEADVNEAGLIDSEALRLETINIVGPAGTPAVPLPGDGYLVIPGASPGQITIHDGIYYLGGWRLTLDQPVAINAQPDWVDAPPLPENGNDLVSLLITEQSVCAVEDQALREVALGGPDTAARLRLMQHFLLLSMTGDTCADGAAVVAGLLAEDGVTLDPYSYQLMSSATLQVGFLPDTAPADPCSPTAAGGYLGADNQLIRVTVSAFDPQAKTGEILWGWNNASILYRATLTDKLAGVFTLTGAPIDQEHAPQLGQAVEILRVRANLKGSNFIAADAGFVTTVSQAYSFDTGTLTIADTLPAEYQSDPGPFFVRLWQAIVPFTAGAATPLDTVSGVTVTVDLTALPTQIAARPFWRFAVRPDTPVQIYPERYQDAPQPPDGPRQWLCDLGVVGLTAAGVFGLLADCRPVFTPLTDQTPGGCCGLTLDPAGVAAMGGLQAVADSLAGAPAVLSLKPGAYILGTPLVLTNKHQGLTIEGCALGVILEPDPNNLAAFIFGLIVLDAANAVTIRGLDFDVPLVAPVTGGQGGTVVGVLAANTTLTVVEDCIFGLTQTSAGAFGGGVTIVGRTLDLSVRRCIFRGSEIDDSALICGVMAAVNNQNVSTLVNDADIVENLFQSLNAGVFVYARLGEVRCASNRVRGCVTGLFFADSSLGGTAGFAKQAVNANQTGGAGLSQAVQAGFSAPNLAMSAQSTAPFFTRATQAEVDVSPVVDDVLEADIAARGAAIYAEIARSAPTMGARTADRAAAMNNTVDATYVAAIDQVNGLSISAEATSFEAIVALLHIESNDITLVSVGANVAVGVGIGVLMSPKDEVGMVQMSANRVVCRDTRTSAASILFPAFLTANANMLVQPPSNPTVGNTPALIVFTLGAALNAIVGNVIRSGAFIVPARTIPAPSPDWAFFNTEG